MPKDQKKEFTELEMIQSVENIYPLLKDEFEEAKEITIDPDHFSPELILADLLKLGMVVKYAMLYDKKVVIGKLKKIRKK